MELSTWAPLTLRLRVSWSNLNWTSWAAGNQQALSLTSKRYRQSLNPYVLKNKASENYSELCKVQVLGAGKIVETVLYFQDSLRALPWGRRNSMYALDGKKQAAMGVNRLHLPRLFIGILNSICKKRLSWLSHCHISWNCCIHIKFQRVLRREH